MGWMHGMHAPCAAVKLPHSFTVPKPYNHADSVPFVRISSCEGFHCLSKKTLGIGTASSNPRRENFALTLANKLFWSKGHMAALYCKIFSPFSNQQCMWRVTHHIQRDAPRMQKVAHSGYSTDTQLAALHHTCIHFNLAALIKKASAS
jgi:hypothetical protein